MAGATMHVEIKTQMDTHNVEQGVIRITKALNKIGIVASETNNMLDQSYSSVQSLTEAANRIGVSSSNLAYFSTQVELLGTVLSETAYASANLAIELDNVNMSASQMLVTLQPSVVQLFRDTLIEISNELYSVSLGLDSTLNSINNLTAASNNLTNTDVTTWLSDVIEKLSNLVSVGTAAKGILGFLGIPLTGPVVVAAGVGLGMGVSAAYSLQKAEEEQRQKKIAIQQETIKNYGNASEDRIKEVIAESDKTIKDLKKEADHAEGLMKDKINDAQTKGGNRQKFPGKISPPEKSYLDYLTQAQDEQTKIDTLKTILADRAKNNNSIESPSKPKVVLRKSNDIALFKQQQEEQEKLKADQEKDLENKRRLEQEKNNFDKQRDLLWQNKTGFLSNTDTLTGLRDAFSSQQASLLAGGTDATDPANWSNAMRANYDLQVQVINRELSPALEGLREQYNKNNLSVEDYRTKLAGLKETYAGYPEILRQVTEEETKLAEAERLAAERKSNTVAIVEKAYKDTQERLNDLAGNTLVQLSDAFASAIVYGESFGDALKKMGDEMMYLAIKSIVLKQLSDWVNSMNASSSGGGGLGLFGTILSVLFSAQGNVFDTHGLQRFAHGGIVSQPTLFPFANGIGLMGEAGPEAIMPLARDGRGNLGVRIAEGTMSGAGALSGVFAPHIEINVENSGSGGDMTDEQARALGAQINAAVEMQVAKQMYDYARSGMFRSGAGRGY